MYLWAQPAPAPIPASQRMVIIVSLDGLPAYALEDPRYPMPTLRRLIREGASVERVTTTNPAFTWPSHTSMLTGLWPAKHGVLYNGLPVRSADSKEPVRIEPHSDKSVLVQATTLYDLAHQAGLTVGHVDWVAIEHAPTVDWEFTEWGNPSGPIEKDLIAAGKLKPADLAGFDKRSMTLRDQVWTAAALDIICKHKPNLMLFHPLNLDHTHHRYGAMSEASETAAAFEDDRLKEILDTVEASDLRDRTTLIVLSDHGFKNPTKTIRPNVVLKAAGIQGAFAVPEGGSAQIYITDPARRDELIPKVKAALANAEGIAKIMDRTDYPALGLPDPLKNPRMGDLFVAAKDGYAFGAGSEGEPVVTSAPYGSHGYLNTDPDMDAIFVAWGYGIRRGAHLDRAAVVDVGPTVAALLGLKMGKIDGHCLTALLQ
ncbi:MAG TPA: ectonucleotide pyrophosphatase/phosphodiesterase [Candidatus Limnocylindrales bacterium]|nr:ectonucleotide pyrophosphatase/phosphodiesterase [Candidatus Limnocylindrales bacterium]